MDGSGSGFLRDPPYFSTLAAGAAGGILYVEDFDLESALSEELDASNPVAQPLEALTLADLDAAREEGRAEGLQAALTDAQFVNTQLQTACLQSLADALGAARGTLERVARDQAESGARAILAVLQAALPAAMAQHAQGEIDAVLRALRPGLVCEPELRVRAHPDLADTVRETLVDLLPQECGVLSVAADPKLARGDVQLAWSRGGAKRDCTEIWNDVRSALAPLSLPAIEEICCGGH